MNEQHFPAGWNEERIQRLLAELDARTEEEWIAADEAAAAGGTECRRPCCPRFEDCSHRTRPPERSALRDRAAITC